MSHDTPPQPHLAHRTDPLSGRPPASATQRRARMIVLCVAVSLIAGFCYMRWQHIQERAQTPVVATTDALRAALLAPPGAARSDAFASARSLAQENVRAAAPILALDPYPIFLLQASEDLDSDNPLPPGVLAQGVASLRAFDLPTARALFTEAARDPALAPRATLYLRLIDDLSAP